MLASADLIAFVGATQLDRSRAFYQGVLGLALVSEDPFGLMLEANGVRLRVARVERVDPAPYTVLGWEVGDIRATLGELASRGIRCERFGGMPQDESGVWTSPSGAQIAWFKDPDGNLLSLTQP